MSDRRMDGETLVVDEEKLHRRAMKIANGMLTEKVGVTPAPVAMTLAMALVSADGKLRAIFPPDMPKVDGSEAVRDFPDALRALAKTYKVGAGDWVSEKRADLMTHVADRIDASEAARIAAEKRAPVVSGFGTRYESAEWPPISLTVVSWDQCTQCERLYFAEKRLFEPTDYDVGKATGETRKIAMGNADICQHKDGIKP